MDYLDHLKTAGDDNWLELSLASRKDNVAELKKIEADILLRYESYDEEIEKFSTKPVDSTFNTTEAKALLINYYENAPATLNRKIQDRRNNHHLEDCPFCGRPVKPDTLDHFIPKDDWPDYSIYPNNLVPQCRGCASKKGVRYFCDNAMTAFFISPIYSDLLSKVSFMIKTSLTKNNTAIEYSIHYNIPKGISDQDKTRIRTHLKKLEVDSSIREFCNMEIGRLERLCAIKSTDISLILNARIEEAKGDGDWKSALYKSLSSSQAIIDYFNDLCPKAVVIAAARTEEELVL